MMNFINSSISNIVDIFPNIIINEVNYSNVNIPKHWKLSQRHIVDLQEIINNYYLKLKQFYGIKSLNPILKNIQSVVESIKLLAISTPYYSSIKDGNKTIETIFDKRLVSMLFKYYFLLTINNYIIT